MLQLGVRGIGKADVAALRRRGQTALGEALTDCHVLFSLACNAAVTAACVAWMRQPVDSVVLQIVVCLALLSLVYKQDSAQAARREALRQMQAALSYFIAVEREVFRDARDARNKFAAEVNHLQQQIDDQKGWWYSWTSFWRHERVVRDTTVLENLALRTSNAVGHALSGPLAETLEQTRGFGPVVFVYLASPQQGQSQRSLALSLLTDPRPDADLRVFGIYFFGTLITRFSAAHAVISLFPDTIESPRIVAMRAEIKRLQALSQTKEREINRTLVAQLLLEHPTPFVSDSKAIVTPEKVGSEIQPVGVTETQSKTSAKPQFKEVSDDIGGQASLTSDDNVKASLAAKSTTTVSMSPGGAAKNCVGTHMVASVAASVA